MRLRRKGLQEAHARVEDKIRKVNSMSKYWTHLVASIKGHKRISRIILCNVSSQTRGNVVSCGTAPDPGPEQSLDDHQREGKLRRPRGTLKCQCHMCLLHGVKANQLITTSEHCGVHHHLRTRLGSCGELTEVLLREVYELRVVHGTSSGHHESAAGGGEKQGEGDGEVNKMIETKRKQQHRQTDRQSGRC